MRVVAVVEAHPAPGDLVVQLVGLVDPDVAALVGVVLVGQQPADLLGQPARHGDGKPSTGLEHPDQFVDRALVLGNVFEDLRGDHAVEGAVDPWQVECVALDRLRLGRRGRLPLLLHCLQDRVDVVEPLAVLVEGHPVGAATDSQLNTSTARRRPAAPRRRNSIGESSSSPSTAVRSSTCPGRTNRAHSPSVPTTSGSAPARLATIGVPLAIASTAGSENPSYSEGMHATSADASRPASSSSLIPLQLCTMSEIPSSAISFSVGPLGSSFDTSWTSRSRSTRSRATACSR